MNSNKPLISEKDAFKFYKKICNIQLDLEKKQQLYNILNKSKNKIKEYLQRKNILEEKNESIDEYIKLLFIWKKNCILSLNSTKSFQQYYSEIENIEKNIYDDLKENLMFNIFDNIPKTNVSAILEYQLFGIDIAYDCKKKKTTILEFNGKILRPTPPEKFKKFYIHKGKIIDNLSKGIHTDVGDFENIFTTNI